MNRKSYEFLKKLHSIGLFYDDGLWWLPVFQWLQIGLGLGTSMIVSHRSLFWSLRWHTKYTSSFPKMASCSNWIWMWIWRSYFDFYFRIFLVTFDIFFLALFSRVLTFDFRSSNGCHPASISLTINFWSTYLVIIVSSFNKLTPSKQSMYDLDLQLYFTVL